jgi:thiamine biosynthesis lipoprotein
VLSATVIAPTAARAEALSTAFYVLGPTAARQWCDAKAGIGAVLLCGGKRAGSLDVHCLGRAADTWHELVDTLE